jgi:hypothetical protein
LGKELSGRELGNYSSENFIADGRKHFLLIIFAQFGVNGVQVIDFRMEKHFHRKLHQLHVSVGSFGSDFVFSRLDIVNDGFFNNGKLEVIAFTVPVGCQSTPEFVELDRVIANIDCIKEKVP